MTRHRGVYKPDNSEPYELSRSRVENFVKCRACFYAKQVKGIDFPSIPGFNINEATDVLLKRDFEQYRILGTTHPFLERLGYGHLVPLKRDNFELWTQSLHFGAKGRFHTIHEETNLKIGGGLDDVWSNTKTGQVHIVDYKSTSQKSPGKEITLEGKWKGSYKRQMDLYIWIMRRIGLDASDTGFFLYCDGDRFTDQKFLGEEEANMRFKMTLLPYSSDQTWIEPTLHQIKDTLHSPICPDHNPYCEYGTLLASFSEL